MRGEILKLSAGWVLCAAAWAACGESQTITSKKLGVQISFSDAFHVDEREVVAALAGCSMFVQAEDVKEDDSLRSLFTISNTRDSFKNDTLADIRIVKLDGRNAIKLSTMGNGGWQTLIYYTVACTRGYTICISGPKTDFDKYAKEIDAMVASFKVIEAK